MASLYFTIVLHEDSIILYDVQSALTLRLLWKFVIPQPKCRTESLIELRLLNGFC